MITHPRLGAAALGGGLEDSIVHLIVEATFEENRRNESALHFPVSVSADACGDLLHLATFSVVDAPHMGKHLHSSEEAFFVPSTAPSCPSTNHLSPCVPLPL